MDFSGSVPVKGGIQWDRDYMGPPNEGKDYKWYISGIFPTNWVIVWYTYHPLQEPKKSIELWVV